MILQIIGRALGMFFLVACVVALSLLMLHQSEKADFRFEVSMGKDINRIARELRETGLEDKSVQVLKYALRDVQRNTQSYVQDKFYDQFFFLMLLAPVFVAFWVASTFQRLQQKNPSR
jgi:hypothetical protein